MDLYPQPRGRMFELTTLNVVELKKEPQNVLYPVVLCRQDNVRIQISKIGKDSLFIVLDISLLEYTYV